MLRAKVPLIVVTYGCHMEKVCNQSRDETAPVRLHAILVHQKALATHQIAMGHTTKAAPSRPPATVRTVVEVELEEDIFSARERGTTSPVCVDRGVSLVSNRGLLDFIEHPAISPNSRLAKRVRVSSTAFLCIGAIGRL